jgi:hypothetical protein
MTISAAQISMRFAAEQINALDLATGSFNLAWGPVWNFADGTGANQAKAVFSDTRTLTASATENLDLAGVLTDAFGATITMAKIKAIMITAASGNTNSVQVTRPASNGVVLFMAAGDGIALTPGAGVCAVFPDANGIAVTAGTGDLLTITNSAGSTSVTYTIAILYTV